MMNLGTAANPITQLHEFGQLRVRDLMTTDLFTLFEEDNLVTLEEVMKWRKVRHIPVLNHQKELVGLVTHRDFLGAAVSQLANLDRADTVELYRQIPISQIMKKEVFSVGPDTTLRIATKTMIENKLGCLFVVDEGNLVGIITEADFVKAFYKYDVALM